MNKKVRIILLSLIAFLILSLTATYGLWYVTRNQTNSNIIATKCLDISLNNEENDITLTEAYPITDEEGLKLTPYTFTVTNNCNTKIDYLLNLELLGDKNTSVSSSAIKLSLNANTTLLSNKETRETTIEDAYESYQLIYGRLEANESEDYNLRLWVDENASVSESNKVFESKISIKSGQEIRNPFNKKTLAYSMVGSSGGVNYITALNSEWKEEIIPEESIYATNDMYHYWATDYEFDSKTGKYTLSGDLVFALHSECKSGAKACGKYTLLQNGVTSASKMYIVTSFTSNQDYREFMAKKLKSYNDFSKISSADYAKVHKADDDLGTSYYYRGNIQNNYVKFGKWSENATEIRGYQNESDTKNYSTYSTLTECKSYSNKKCEEVTIANIGDDMYWRIVRVNGDGTIRLIYDGTEAVANGIKHASIIGNGQYSTRNNQSKYVEYTYSENGKQVDSTIKEALDNWYIANLKIDYEKYIADGIFCNDRASRIENSRTYYAARDRLYLNRTPQLTCNQKEDRYTINTEYGNGYLTYPVGLLTADEIMMAGAVDAFDYVPNNSFYLYNGYSYWTISPSSYSADGNRYASVFTASDDLSPGMIVSSNLNIRPVINLKAHLKFMGNGTINSPYEIIVD